MDRIQKVNERVDDLIVEVSKKHQPKVIYSSDKPILAGSIYFLGFVLLFLASFFFSWALGWKIAIAVIGVCVVVYKAEESGL